MTSFKGILKYCIYIFIAGWLFFLGILVGRGSSPVTFDTRQFQKRLERIANEFGEKKGDREKIDLKFYDVLDRPVPEEGSISQEKTQEIIPGKVSNDIQEIPLKTSKKRLTFNEKISRVSTDAPIKKMSKTKASGTLDIEKSKDRMEENITGGLKTDASLIDKKAGKKVSKKIGKGTYTIQVAAFKAFKDAVTQMADLEKKGFTSYRVKVQKDGTTWYRVRTGSFASYEAAKQYKEKLDKARISAMIIKKDSDENIKE